MGLEWYHVTDIAVGPLAAVAGAVMRGTRMDRRKRSMALVTRMMRRKNGKTAGWKRITKRFGITPQDERDALVGTVSLFIWEWMRSDDAATKAANVADEFFRFNASCSRGNFDARNGNVPNRVGW